VPHFASVTAGRERWGAHAAVPRHRHRDGYVALVLAGGYEECGSHGRFRVGPGDVLVHGPFEAHLDRFTAAGADIVNLSVPALGCPPLRRGRVRDADAIARLAQRDRPAAAAELVRQLYATASPSPDEPTSRVVDWPDLLAAELLRDPACRLDAWARRHGLAAATVSRGFGRTFGVTPAAFRLEARAHLAFARIVTGAQPLADVAQATGFADQAHMSRAVRALTGAPPAAWRGSNRFKTR